MPDLPPAHGLDERCPACDRVCGDHALREWVACMGNPTTDLPYAELPDDIAAAATENLRRTFGLDEDVIVADHVVAKALVFTAGAGPVRVDYPAVLHEFQVGVLGHPPAPIAKLLFAGNHDGIRAYGRLIRDTANGAVNAARRAA